MTATTAAPREATTPAEESSFLRRVMSWLFVVGGIVGLVASADLTIEKLAQLTNPGYQPSCSINPVLSCGSVTNTPQAALFGFPNPLLGIGAYSVLITVGVALFAGFRPPRWFWSGVQIGVTLGVIFVHWLFFQSVYRIGALCPYCMVVWAVTIPTFWYTTLYNLRNGGIPVPESWRSGVRGLSRFHSLVLVLWALVLIALILQAFWYYWRTLF